MSEKLKIYAEILRQMRGIEQGPKVEERGDDGAEDESKDEGDMEEEDEVKPSSLRQAIEKAMKGAK